MQSEASIPLAAETHFLLHTRTGLPTLRRECAMRCLDSKVCLAGKTETSSLPRN